jgi:methionyl-tRNA synthetase
MRRSRGLGDVYKRQAQTIWERIGMPGQITDQRLPLAVAWGGYPGGISIDKGEPLFPRRKLTEN